MAEWERLESRLKDLQSAATDWVDGSLDPEDVRRLGDRRRHRRWAATVVAAVVIAIGGGAGVYAAGNLSHQQTPTPVGRPTIAMSPTPTEDGSSEPAAAYGSLIEIGTARPQPRGEPIPPAHRRERTGSPSPTPASPTPASPTPASPSPTPTPSGTPTSSDDPTPTPSPTQGSQTSQPEPGRTEGPGPGPTEPAPTTGGAGPTG